ncbi:Uncharacterised protein [Burkholderia pseudomallei]|nr:Uncharacterised protein [Burkholderia pseudomallei]
MRRELQRRGARPRALHLDVLQVIAHELAHARRAVDVRDDFQQEVRAGEALCLLFEIELLVLVAHRARRDAHGAVVERAEQRIDVRLQRRLREFLRESPQFAAARDRRVIVQIHRERIAAGLALVFDGDHLAALGVIAEAGRIGHANEFVMNEWFLDLERLRHDFAQAIHVGAIRDDQEFPIDETVRAHRECRARERHRECFRSDLAWLHVDSLWIASLSGCRYRMLPRIDCAMPQLEKIIAEFAAAK